MVFGGGVYGRWWGHESGDLTNEFSVLAKETADSSVTPSTTQRHREKTSLYEPEASPHQTLNVPAPRSRTAQPPKLWEMFVVHKPPSWLDFFCSCPKTMARERWRREHSESILLEPLWWQPNTSVLRIDLHGHFLFQTELETPWGQETMLWPWTFPVHSSVDSTLHALNTNICSNVPFSEKPFWTHPNLQSPDSKWEGTLSFLLLYPLCLKQET